MKLTKKIKDFFQELKKPNYIPVFKAIEEKEILKGKVSLVIGGDGGIGMAITERLLACGSMVIPTCSSKEKANAFSIKNERCKSLVLNLNDIGDFPNFIKDAKNVFGKIDNCIFASGVHLGRNGLDFLNVSESEFDKIININMKGMYFFCQQISQYFIENQVRGHLCIISSQSALEPAWSPYRISKHFTASLIEGMGQRLIKYGIVVNGVGPGPTATQMQNYCMGDSIFTNQTPLGRYTLPEEVAYYSSVLVSELGNTIIGQTIYLSGGRGIVEIR